MRPKLKPKAVERAERALCARAVSWAADRRGHTRAERWLVGFEDGRSAFVKAAVDENTGEWLRREARIYGDVRRTFLARRLAWETNDPPLLVLEDLSRATWPPPWDAAMIAAVLAGLRAVAATPPPEGVGRLDDRRARFDGWREVARDPEPFLSLGFGSRSWLEAALPALIEASDAAVLDGDALVHGDVRSDNICFVEERVVFIDWNEAAAGNPVFDVAFWLPSLALEGGPAPDEIAPRYPGIAGLASVVASYFAARAGLPPLPGAPRVRPLQLAQLRVALPWALRELSLPALR